ncbi:hypothetical protein CspeluHIS016_0600570 [Cutaneotrichosporon spelunceum]|uniref:Concanavalin A-like lectin/glucanase n=1 Tax=Cutaneotrichosporon spelunceum TaxID=1672016 RepID=A0AAD3TY53_9TREE|nr:hypothetical protein CspeluHIS016_0600570 [Cutaneotrichosporon spelunceum]
MTTIPFSADRWGPLDAAHALEGSVCGDSLTHTTVGDTDWWRTTARHQVDGPVRGFWHPVGEGLEVSVELSISTRRRTLFLYVSPTRWVKAGIEFDDGALWNGAVVTNPYSDWSKSRRGPADSARYTISYGGNVVQIYLGDEMIRQVMWFGPTRDGDADVDAEVDRVFVGVMACSPQEGGAEVSWRNFTLKTGARPH